MLICQTDQREIKATFLEATGKMQMQGKDQDGKNKKKNEKRKQHLLESSNDKEKIGSEQI